MKKEIDLTQKEFELFQKFIFKEIGISFENSKKFLVKNRLLKQLHIYNFESFSDYYRYIQINKTEKIAMLNLVTTNETYFFREKKHFEFLENDIIPKALKDKKSLRLWSAASSNGAEAYSLAMLLDNNNLNFEIFASDINTEVIKKAKIGLYPIKMMDKIPDILKKKYCLLGKGKHEGWFLVDRVLVPKIIFQERNLINIQSDLGLFDIIFLRNVLIYFNDDMKEQIIKNVLNNLKVGGYLIVSLTEYIRDLDKYNLIKVDNSIYQKVDL